MLFLLGILVFIFGSIIGSFLNVVALRYKTGRTVGGRSFCFSCGSKLRAHELIPILSFLLQKGKCKTCRTGISFQYPIVEAGTGLVFLLIFLKLFGSFGGLPLIVFPFLMFAFSLMIVICVYDLKHKIIPDLLSYTLIISSLLFMIGTHDMRYFASSVGILNLFGGLLLFLPFFALWLVSRGKWIGLGDGKLSAGIGWLLGFPIGLSAVVVGFWIGALWGVFMMFYQRISGDKKVLGMKSEVPFAPFLCLGALVAFLFDLDLFKIEFILFLR